MREHETYVWQENRRWYWRCLGCGIRGSDSYSRRMDADDRATDHSYGGLS